MSIAASIHYRCLAIARWAHMCCSLQNTNTSVHVRVSHAGRTHTHTHTRVARCGLPSEPVHTQHMSRYVSHAGRTQVLLAADYQTHAYATHVRVSKQNNMCLNRTLGTHKCCSLHILMCHCSQLAYTHCVCMAGSDAHDLQLVINQRACCQCFTNACMCTIRH